MQILSVYTNNSKLDLAYKKMQEHINMYENLEEFIAYFNNLTKEVNKDELLSWLIKVLFWEFRYGRDNLLNELVNTQTKQNKSDWDILLDNVSSKDRDSLESWLSLQLERLEKN